MQPFQARTCFEKDVILPRLMRRAALHLSRSAILSSPEALIACKTCMAMLRQMRRRVANDSQKRLGYYDHNTGDRDPATVVAAHSRSPHKSSINPSSQHITLSRFATERHRRLRIPHVSIAHHVIMWASPCSPPPPSNNRLGDAACPLEGTWHMHGRSHRAGATHMHTHHSVTTKRPRRWLACDRLLLLSLLHSHACLPRVCCSSLSIAHCYRLHESRTSMLRVPRPKWVALFKLETACGGATHLGDV